MSASSRLGIWLAVAAAAAAACSGPVRRPPPPLADQVANGDRDLKSALRSELESEILDDYDRDAPPDLETKLLPVVGAARIGVGPGDFLVDQELANASSRWPLTISPEMLGHARSKNLELHLAADSSAAWAFDEVSWRFTVCGRTLVVPLRLTALYARDGDRWVPALEHLSWGAALDDDAPVVGRSVPSATAAPELTSALEAAVAPLLQVPIVSSPLVSVGPEALLLGPGWDQEWHGALVAGHALAQDRLELEDHRVGIIGRTPAEATIAYLAGNLRAADGGAGPRLRATFVFERREQPVVNATANSRSSAAAQRWVLVQGHVSAPIDDESLARATVGSAAVRLNPLVVQCPGGG